MRDSGILGGGLTTGTIEGRWRLAGRLQEFTVEFPWQ